MASIKLSLRKEAEPSGKVPKYIQEIEDAANADEARERNPFDLYDSVAGWQRVSVEIQKVIDRCVEDIAEVARRYDNYGANDTASREAIQTYVSDAIGQAL